MVWFTILELHTDMLFQIQVHLLSHPNCSGFACISPVVADDFYKGSLMKVHYPKLYNMAHLLALYFYCFQRI